MPRSPFKVVEGFAHASNDSKISRSMPAVASEGGAHLLPALAGAGAHGIAEAVEEREGRGAAAGGGVGGEAPALVVLADLLDLVERGAAVVGEDGVVAAVHITGCVYG